MMPLWMSTILALTVVAIMAVAVYWTIEARFGPHSHPPAILPRPVFEYKPDPDFIMERAIERDQSDVLGDPLTEEEVKQRADDIRHGHA